MGWWGRGWGRGWSPYPGNGPFSYLPPWERPGWKYGRGWCWWYYGYPYSSSYPYPVAPFWADKSAELRYLEDMRKYLEDVKKDIEARIEELKKSTQ
ncbi:DUF5320 domain-containing protein [Fervidicoccus fontis]|jgi:hypothetical protein|nr:DUF5320 domain-containing protein [Fervidicoccus fontis]MBE9391248.1 DUF5320 domain-containing protein [Fervidicoccus fontis]PNV81863.1 MAG: hypothetical protein C0179_00530 [Fervidicoccus sp.]